MFDDRKSHGTPHKDMIVRIDFIAKERKYISFGCVLVSLVSISISSPVRPLTHPLVETEQ